MGGHGGTGRPGHADSVFSVIEGPTCCRPAANKNSRAESYRVGPKGPGRGKNRTLQKARRGE